MNNFTRHIARLSDWITCGLELVLLAIIIFGLTEWWGTSWLVTVLLPIALFVVVFTVVYRLIRGKWPSFFLTFFGSLAGCAGVFLIFPVALIYPVVYRFMEGEWPFTYLCLLAALFVVRLVKEYFERRKV